MRSHGPYDRPLLAPPADLPPPFVEPPALAREPGRNSTPGWRGSTRPERSSTGTTGTWPAFAKRFPPPRPVTGSASAKRLQPATLSPSPGDTP
jgi:hypothetical protein